jgi:putative aldouronate transport system permease protein
MAHFIELFRDSHFYVVLVNTVIINILTFCFSFPFIIFLALMLNEIKLQAFKRTMQTFVYLPNFINWVVFGGLITLFLSPQDGPIGGVVRAIWGRDIYFLQDNRYFRGVLVASSLVKNAGFSTIVYLAGLAGVNPELYESAIIDGANRFHLNWHINLPRIKPTIAVLFILNMAQMFSSNFDQVFNLYNPTVWDTGDVISTYLYRRGLLECHFEFSTAMGLLFGLVSLLLIIYTNKIVRKMNVTGIF